MLKSKCLKLMEEIKHYQSNAKSVRLIISDENKATHLEELRKIQIAELKAQIEEEKQLASDQLANTIAEFNSKIAALKAEYSEYRLLAKEEIKINESIRFQQRIEINKLKTTIKKLNKVMLIPRLHSKYCVQIQEGKYVDLDYLTQNGTPNYETYRNNINQFEFENQSQYTTLINQDANSLKDNDKMKMMKISRNTTNRLNKHTSMNTLRIVKTSHSRAGHLTDRETTIRPTTGLGLITESTQGTEEGHKRRKIFSRKGMNPSGIPNNMSLAALFSQTKQEIYDSSLPRIHNESIKEGLETTLRTGKFGELN